MTKTDLPTEFSDPARFILHPTDFSPQSESAFAHALRLALTNNAILTLLHVEGARKVSGTFVCRLRSDSWTKC